MLLCWLLLLHGAGDVWPLNEVEVFCWRQRGRNVLLGATRCRKVWLIRQVLCSGHPPCPTVSAGPRARGSRGLGSQGQAEGFILYFLAVRGQGRSCRRTYWNRRPGPLSCEGRGWLCSLFVRLLWRGQCWDNHGSHTVCVFRLSRVRDAFTCKVNLDSSSLLRKQTPRSLKPVVPVSGYAGVRTPARGRAPAPSGLCGQWPAPASPWWGTAASTSLLPLNCPGCQSQDVEPCAYKLK